MPIASFMPARPVEWQSKTRRRVKILSRRTLIQFASGAANGFSHARRRRECSSAPARSLPAMNRRSKKRPAAPPRKLLLETFEDRILCSATVPVDAAPQPQQLDAQTAAASIHQPAAPPAPGPLEAASSAEASQLTDAEVHVVVAPFGEAMGVRQHAGKSFAADPLRHVGRRLDV